jgi:3-hydroxyisobutyrate dehydrogenase
MGGALAERLAAAGVEVRLYDVATAPRERFHVSARSLAEAASGCQLVLLCLPDAEAVEGAVADLLRADRLPNLVVDLTSSVPDATRRLGVLLFERGIGLIDAPLSGGVAGARQGKLTAMVGGPAALLERATPILKTFASRIERAGDLGAGHAVKAINNTLSAVSLLATSRAVRAARSEGEALAYFNSHRGRSQNSEVKFPRDILPRSFEAGFTLGLMLKDVGIASGMGDTVNAPIPITRRTRAELAEAARTLGAGADFTRVFEVVEPWPTATHSELDERLYATSRAAAEELIELAARVGVDPARALEIVNASTGRSEATLDLARAGAWR